MGVGGDGRGRGPYLNRTVRRVLVALEGIGT